MEKLSFFFIFIFKIINLYKISFNIKDLLTSEALEYLANISVRAYLNIGNVFANLVVLVFLRRIIYKINIPFLKITFWNLIK
jgi:hypothetical protein